VDYHAQPFEPNRFSPKTTQSQKLLSVRVAQFAQNTQSLQARPYRAWPNRYKKLLVTRAAKMLRKPGSPAPSYMVDAFQAGGGLQPVARPWAVPSVRLGSGRGRLRHSSMGEVTERIAFSSGQVLLRSKARRVAADHRCRVRRGFTPNRVPVRRIRYAGARMARASFDPRLPHWRCAY
jgi:hypothetical protein